MSLHFLLKAEARTMSLVEVLALSEDEAVALFKRLRWGDGDEVVCPHCGAVHRHYYRPARRIWRCAACREDFSVTSGTLFAFHTSCHCGCTWRRRCCLPTRRRASPPCNSGATWV